MRLSALKFYVQELLKIKKIANKYNLPNLTELEIGRYKTSDTIFILGSGDSINNYSAAQWKEISDQDSIGFNYWPIHNHVPTFYSVECASNLNIRKEQINLLNTNKKAYKKTPIILKDIFEGYWQETVPLIDPELKPNLYIAKEIQLTGRSCEDYLRSIKMYENLGMIKEGSFKYIPRKIGSLIFLLFFAFFSGYKKVVLCGIDLDGGSSFYLNERYSKQQEHLQHTISAIKSKKHHTLDKSQNFVTMPELLSFLNKKYFQEKGLSIYLGNKQSSLYPEFSLFNYKCAITSKF
ncbi:hypothetical protein N7E81_05740 [Reichenbachiella carrageenanivorans]|uniref:Uncharacterized protein n=1 Tax=Reichenbachiella carrageenanivorans TaxID=2979869 RepID=A0ABY6D470_9BACT|nr:hypothetical protein [Reichenbachiella carrageenanivorans]UXX80599.1 hypothetical protein N7E81_05740 [Reichenbachiella carrageenanivorans]